MTRWVVVVGTGTAGGVMAARLAKHGHDVTLIEAGRAAADLFPGPFARGRGIGGSSAVNGMIATPGDLEQYARWGWHDAAGALAHQPNCATLRVVAVARYISHPEVVVDPAVPVDRWVLSERGLARLPRLLESSWVAAISRIVASAEPKARLTADALAAGLGLPVETRPNTGEIDRSATGFLQPDDHESVADACFAQPAVSARGWERAVDAQARIVAALADLLVEEQRGDVAIVGHGGVGTLWFCHLAGTSIDRRWDQPGQGHYFSVDLSTRRPLHHWRPFEATDATPGGR